MFLEPGALALFSTCFLWSRFVQAAIVNRTIDDWFGDSATAIKPVFRPDTVGTWKDEQCSDCSINPDTSRTFRQTYTAATYSPRSGPISIRLQFEGVAVHVFFILANNAGDGITSITDCDFILNGGSPVKFRHAPDLTTTDILYNQLAFSRTDLPNGNYTLDITTDGVDHNVYVNFDYAIYTHDDDPVPTNSTVPPPSGTVLGSSTSGGPSGNPSSPTNAPSSGNAQGSSPTDNPPSNTDGATGRSAGGSNTSDTSTSKSVPVGAIVGGVVGGIIALTVIAYFAICFRRRKYGSMSALQGNNTIAELEAEPYPINTTNQGAQSAYEQAPSTTGIIAYPYSDLAPGLSQLSSKFQPSFYGPPSSFPTHQSTSSAPHNHVASQSYTQGSVYSDPRGGIAGASQSANDSSSSTNPTGSSQCRLVVLNQFTPLSPTPTTPASSNPEQVEVIRRARREVIDQHLRSVQQEMSNLGRDIKGRSLRRTAAQNLEAEQQMTIQQMREQMQIMQRQIEILRENQNSDWAAGLTDAPPPGYDELVNPPIPLQTPPPLLPPKPTNVQTAS